MISNRQTLNEAHKEITKLKERLSKSDERFKLVMSELLKVSNEAKLATKGVTDLGKKDTVETISSEEIIKIVRDTINLSFVNNLYGRK